MTEAIETTESTETTETTENSQQQPTEPETQETSVNLIEATVITYLADTLKTNDVYAERPASPPDEYYIIERTASGEINHVQRATIAIQSISGSSLLRAAQMNQAVLKAMPLLVQVTHVSCCRLNSAYNYTDTESRQYRYQAVFDIYYMEGE